MNMMENQPIYSIVELNSSARLLLEEGLGQVWVLGEISNLARPGSGHLYFTLKDATAQVRSALFRLQRQKLDFAPENGQQVLVKAMVSIYEGRGDYQLIIHDMQLAGSGALQIAFEKLKNKLKAQGLFDDQHKKPIPKRARCIGVITSPSGAAIRDILKVLRRRSPSTAVIIYPCLVQGDQAKHQIVRAIQIANERHECDLLLVSRGGGSLEDLWPFNEECVAQALFESQLPVVTGIGHEVDHTIADLVADYRAATPSAAAEYISVDQQELIQELNHIEQHLTRNICHFLAQLAAQLNHLKKRLRHPRDKLREQTQTIDQIEHRLVLLMQHQLREARLQLSNLSAKLNTLSPLSTLQRGYAIITDAQQRPIESIVKVTRGMTLNARLSDGQLQCTVDSIHEKTE